MGEVHGTDRIVGILLFLFIYILLLDLILLPVHNFTLAKIWASKKINSHQSLDGAAGRRHTQKKWGGNLIFIVGKLFDDKISD